ncbi:phosphonate C-P lyase system protein PhnH [Pseudooceanicola aestuarii]|uniref:phosphonate C-P lyase system protein PhnH n=1 Tax=Pseudooceanicola aestuarii TaxID=2697319 RepID=UPI0013D37492|nr:phosphonate C-P lyase system protein PhnH [Pseudooceanicola aestuarii]
MSADALRGGFSDAPAQSARAFRAALEGLARPGTVQVLADLASAPAPTSPAAATLLLTLCDQTTPLHLAGDHDCAPLRDWVTFHTGAPLTGAADAVFALGAWDALTPLDRFAIGTAEYPDRSATLIVDGWPALRNVTLRGPGLKGDGPARLPEVTAFRDNRALFPLGQDFYFTEGARLWALPRSTEVH